MGLWIFYALQDVDSIASWQEISRESRSVVSWDTMEWGISWRRRQYNSFLFLSQHPLCNQVGSLFSSGTTIVFFTLLWRNNSPRYSNNCAGSRSAPLALSSSFNARCRNNPAPRQSSHTPSSNPSASRLRSKEGTVGGMNAEGWGITTDYI
jgi:hypothetical protein